MTPEQLLFTQGFGSRKMCASLVADGALSVNGVIVNNNTVALDIDAPDFNFEVVGANLGTPWPYREKAYVMLNKPMNFECSQKPKSHPSVYNLLANPLRTRSGGGLQSVGRLDHDTTGLLLFSDDGQFIHKMSSPKHHVPKVYDVTTSESISDEQIKKLLAGVILEDDPKPVHALAITRMDAPNKIHMTLAQGKYHQVKRMMAAVKNHVDALHRSQIGALKIPADLALGEWRWLSTGDLSLAKLKNSSAT
jgi:16S rRNA pseudouridine516 synthase